MADPSRSEADIVAALQAGERPAAAEFVELHQEAVYRVAGRLVGRWNVAEDIVQDTFIRAFDRIHEIDARRGATGWLLKTAVNLCRDYLKHASRREVPETVADDALPLFTGSTPDPEGALDARERRQRLDRALHGLSLSHREVLVLHDIEELPFDRIASILGTPSAALRIRAMRARNRLRLLLEEEPA